MITAAGACLLPDESSRGGTVSRSFPRPQDAVEGFIPESNELAQVVGLAGVWVGQRKKRPAVPKAQGSGLLVWLAPSRLRNISMMQPMAKENTI